MLKERCMLITIGLLITRLSWSADILLNNVRIIDGSGRAGIEKGAMLIHENKIKKVYQKAFAQPPKDVTSIDLTGKTIIPALINAHCHLGLTKGTSTADANNTVENVKHQLQYYAMYGVGTVVSLGRDQDFIYQLRKELPPDLPAVLTAGQGFGVSNGMPPALNRGHDPVYRPHSPDEVIKDMEQLANLHPDLVKLWLDNWFNTMTEMKPPIYSAVIRSAHQYHLQVASHVFYLDDAKALVHDNIDILAHSIRDKLVDKMLIDEMKKKHVALIPTLQLDEAYYIYKTKPEWMFTPFFKDALAPGVWEQLIHSSYTIKEEERSVLKIAQQNLKTLYKNGIPIAFGTDSGAIPTRVQGFAEHRELQLMVEAGLTPLQALTIATGGTAKIMKIENKYGLLKKGNIANFIILNANPIDNIANTQQIEAVWFNGRKVSGHVHAL